MLIFLILRPSFFFIGYIIIITSLVNYSFSGESFNLNIILFASKITQNTVTSIPYAIKGARNTSCTWHRVSTEE